MKTYEHEDQGCRFPWSLGVNSEEGVAQVEQVVEVADVAEVILLGFWWILGLLGASCRL